MSAGVSIRNALRAALAGLGGSRSRGHWGKFMGETHAGAIECYLNKDYVSWHSHSALTAESTPDELQLLDDWCEGLVAPQLQHRLANLDFECELAGLSFSTFCIVIVIGAHK